MQVINRIWYDCDGHRRWNGVDFWHGRATICCRRSIRCAARTVTRPAAGSAWRRRTIRSAARRGTTGPGHDCDDDSQCPPGQHCGDLSYKCLGDGECVYKEDCEAGLTCQGGKCVIGGDCGAQSFELTKLAPNVMIVLDRSGSMDGDVQNSNKSRWEVAKDAIFQLVDTFNSDIRFGLVTYSACVLLNECTAGEIEVAIIDKAARGGAGFD